MTGPAASMRVQKFVSPCAARRPRGVEPSKIGCPNTAALRTRGRQLQKARDVFRVVLTIGVDLQRMRKPELPGRNQTSLYRGAFAAVAIAPHDAGGVAAPDGVDRVTPGAPAAVVNHDHLAEVPPHFFHDARHRERVVEGGDDGTGAEGFGHAPNTKTPELTGLPSRRSSKLTRSGLLQSR